MAETGGLGPESENNSRSSTSSGAGRIDNIRGDRGELPHEGRERQRQEAAANRWGGGQEIAPAGNGNEGETIQGEVVDDENERGGGGRNGGGDIVPPNTEGGERDRRRSFAEVQGELTSLVDSPPDRDREDGLIMERARILREAYDRGIFNGIKTTVADLQNSANFEASINAVQNLNADDFIRAMRAQGLIDLTEMNMEDVEDELNEYKDVAALVMRHALLTAIGNNGNPDWQNVMDRITREVHLRAWNTVPRTPYSLAAEYVARKREQAVAEATAEANRRTARRGEQEEPEVEYLRPEENSPEGWARLVFSNIARAEQKSEKDGTTSKEDEKIWLSIERALERMPNFREGGRHQILSDFYWERFPEGVFLKEKLQLYFEARRRLNDRFIEVSTANGSLAAMGIGSEDIQLKTVKYTVTDIRPMDWWMLINGDYTLQGDLVRLTNGEKREFLPNTASGLTAWWNIGVTEHRLFTGTLNNARATTRLRQRLAIDLGSRKAEELAYRMHTVTLTLSMFDWERRSTQGKSEDRDLIWFDTKRVQDFGAKEREPGVDWTIGRYFSKDNQARAVNPDAAQASRKMQRRQEMLQKNSERSVFVQPEGYFRGQAVSDFWNMAIYVPDELDFKDRDAAHPDEPVEAIERKLISYVLDKNGVAHENGWRKIPFYYLGGLSYSGYFSYPLKIVGAITGELGSTKWEKIDEITAISFWEDKRGLLDRLKATSPWLNAAEFEFRGKILGDFLTGLGGIPEEELNRIVGYSDESDLDVISDEDKRQRALNYVRRKKNPGDRHTVFAEAANKTAETYLSDSFEKLRMIYALGIIFPGSLFARQETEKPWTGSTITPGNLAAIVDALRASNFLGGAAIQHFLYEAYHEMGIGLKAASEMGKRY